MLNCCTSFQIVTRNFCRVLSDDRQPQAQRQLADFSDCCSETKGLMGVAVVPLVADSSLYSHILTKGVLLRGLGSGQNHRED